MNPAWEADLEAGAESVRCWSYRFAKRLGNADADRVGLRPAFVSKADLDDNAESWLGHCWTVARRVARRRDPERGAFATLLNRRMQGEIVDQIRLRRGRVNQKDHQRKFNYAIESLDAPVSPRDDRTRGDLVAADPRPGHDFRSLTLDEMLEDLHAMGRDAGRARQVIAWRCHGVDAAEIAERLGLSQATVFTIQRRALGVLAARMGATRKPRGFAGPKRTNTENGSHRSRGGLGVNTERRTA